MKNLLIPTKPLDSFKIPESDSPNSFGAKRKYDYHTGVDLFCNTGDKVYSMYNGIITNILEFTGFKDTPFWNDTYAVMIYHPDINKTFLYGELEPLIKVGELISKGDIIGTVLRVLKNDKGLPTTMLHMECYSGMINDCVWWKHNEDKPENLEDITKYLNYAN
jgi:murein DD-endopeptidase MepM/ murein hydrolase activator NlpD